jgi:hypothetical protein
MVERRPGEWRVSHEESGGALDVSLEIAAEVEDVGSEELAHRRRVPTVDDGTLRVTPRLADRSIVFRPEVELLVLPDESVDLFVSSVVWVEVGGGEAGRTIVDLPTHRPSDTWLGPTSIQGELCYASRTHCRLHLDELPMRPHRATTPVRVRNRATEPLLLERMSVPLPHLGLFADDAARLWTSAVELTRERDEAALAKLRVDPEPPDGVGSKPIAAPRREVGAGGFVRAFSELF